MYSLIVVRRFLFFWSRTIVYDSKHLRMKWSEAKRTADSIIRHDSKVLEVSIVVTYERLIRPSRNAAIRSEISRHAEAEKSA